MEMSCVSSYETFPIQGASSTSHLKNNYNVFLENFASFAKLANKIDSSQGLTHVNKTACADE